MRQIRDINITNPRIVQPMTMALLADFHNGEYADLLPILCGCDAILIAGDMVDRHKNTWDKAAEFLQILPEVAPTFYALGNHERKFRRLAEYWPHVESSGVTVLDNRYEVFGGVVIGGLSSAHGVPETAWLADMARQPGYRLLMCHHPEYFARYVQPYDVDLTLSGHAHGGQWRIGEQGLYAPGQGILPKYTSGYYFGGRLLVSRGLTNATWAPRFRCPCEVMLLHLRPEG